MADPIASLDEKKTAIRAVLTDLAAAAETAGLPWIARDVRDTRLPKLDDERFSVVVLGEFNHGKSTFINALLGSPLLPTGITPPPTGQDPEIFIPQNLTVTAGQSVTVPVNLTVSRLHVRPKPLGLVIARDDRERRAAFNQTRRVEAELRKVLAGAPAALWSAERTPGPDVGLGWQFRYVSPLLAKLAGRPTDYFDHPLRWAEAVHPHDREAYRAALRGLLTGTDAGSLSGKRT